MTPTTRDDVKRHVRNTILPAYMALDETWQRQFSGLFVEVWQMVTAFPHKERHLKLVS